MSISNGQPEALKQSHRDLGIITTLDLTWTNRHEYVLCYIKHTRFLVFFDVHSLMLDVHLPKRLSLVRSQLMYCSQILCPQYLKGETSNQIDY